MKDVDEFLKFLEIFKKYFTYHLNFLTLNSLKNWSFLIFRKDKFICFAFKHARDFGHDLYYESVATVISSNWIWKFEIFYKHWYGMEG